jgi:hypothetical protein
MAEAAAANGIPKIIISDEVAAYTASSVQNPVRAFPSNMLNQTLGLLLTNYIA